MVKVARDDVAQWNELVASKGFVPRALQARAIMNIFRGVPRNDDVDPGFDFVLKTIDDAIELANHAPREKLELRVYRQTEHFAASNAEGFSARWQWLFDAAYAQRPQRRSAISLHAIFHPDATDSDETS